MRDEADVLMPILCIIMLSLFAVAFCEGCGEPTPYIDAGASDRVPIADVCFVIENHLGCEPPMNCRVAYTEMDDRTCSLSMAQECLQAAEASEDACLALHRDPLCMREICD